MSKFHASSSIELSDDQLEHVAGGYLGLAAGAVTVGLGYLADQAFNDGKITQGVKDAAKAAGEAYEELKDTLSGATSGD